MGSEAKTTLTIGRQSYQGTALLESDELRFRGDTRLRIALRKLAEIGTRISREGCIRVVHPRGDAPVADTVIFAAARNAGLTYTRVVRFSETDRAEKLVFPRAAR